MSSLFSQPAGGSVFGQNNNQQQQPNNNPFGSTSIPNKPSLFAPLSTNTATTQAQTGGGLFGSTSQPQQTGGGLFGSQQQPQQSGGSLFSNLGNTTGQQTQQTTGGLFGSQQQQPQQGGGLFGAANNQQNQSQQGGGLFAGNSGFGQTAQQPQQNNQQQTNIFGQTQGQQRLFMQSGNSQPQKNVLSQIERVFEKWHPQHPYSSFQTYLYNTVPKEQASFYGPTPADDEAKWEEALNKRPSPSAVPVLAQGFEGLGYRMKMQYEVLQTLSGRLHEINDGLNNLLQKHDLEISIRTAECRKKHLRMSQQCLALAAKTQILRNRGYAMDSAEEELRKRLIVLEKEVFDPALNGRGEEIWARMVSVRERGRQLQREFERAGTGVMQGNVKVLDEEVVAKTRKILEDYSSQLAHLTKEMARIQNDWKEWESSKPPGDLSGPRNSTGRREGEKTRDPREKRFV